jgi:hypothetical protein
MGVGMGSLEGQLRQLVRILRTWENFCCSGIRDSWDVIWCNRVFFSSKSQCLWGDLWGANLRWDGRISWGVQCPLHPNGQGRSDVTEFCGLTEISSHRSSFKTDMYWCCYKWHFLQIYQIWTWKYTLAQGNLVGVLRLQLEMWLVVNVFSFPKDDP